MPRAADDGRSRPPAPSAIGLPRWTAEADAAATALADVDRWFTDVAVSGLVQVFGGELSSSSPDGVANELEMFAATHWDFRGGRERNLAAVATLTRRQESLILDIAESLGLAGIVRPRRKRYDRVVMTGGMVRAGLVKPRFVAGLLDAGLDVGEVVFLGAFRPFAGDERDLAERLDVAGDNEVDAMIVGLERAFGPLGSPASRHGGGDPPASAWIEYRYVTDRGPVTVAAAPSARPDLRRANTADTFRFWAEQLKREWGGDDPPSVLVVTTPVYVPYQNAVAVEVLGLGSGFEVETIGTSAAASDLGELTQRFEPRHHLQELRSAIGAMTSLRRALVMRQDDASAPLTIGNTTLSVHGG